MIIFGILFLILRSNSTFKITLVWETSIDNFEIMKLLSEIIKLRSDL